MSVASAPGVDGFVAFNFSAISATGFFNTQGTFVTSPGELTVAHELYHQFADPIDPPASPGWDPNGATADHYGNAIRFQNTVATELGLTDHVQAGYAAYGDTALFDLDRNYTSGQPIDIAYIGNEFGRDNLDFSARTDNSRDLIFGLGGDDDIAGGGGADHLYGGNGNDTILGGDGDDYLYGEAGSDILRGGAGWDVLDGGDGNDLLDSGDASIAVDGVFAPTWVIATNALLGGAGDDILISRGLSFINGGPGNDRIHILTPQGQTIVPNGGFDAAIIDPEPGDRLFWNGHALLGSGTNIVLDIEISPGRGFNVHLGQIDTNGVIYLAGRGGGLTIILPNGQSILVDFQNGDLGITMPQPDYDTYQEVFDQDGHLIDVLFPLAESSIVRSGAFGEWDVLAGSAGAAANASFGPEATPLVPLP